jgi:hypothetical protein
MSYLLCKQNVFQTYKRMDEDGLRLKQHTKKLQLDAHVAKEQADFSVEKTLCTKRQRGRSPRLVQQDIKVR